MKFQFLSLTFCYSFVSISVFFPSFFFCVQFEWGDGENGDCWAYHCIEFDQEDSQAQVRIMWKSSHRLTVTIHEDAIYLQEYFVWNEQEWERQRHRKWKYSAKMRRKNDVAHIIPFVAAVDHHKHEPRKWNGIEYDANANLWKLRRMNELFSFWIFFSFSTLLLFGVRTFRFICDFIFFFHWRIADAAVGKTFMDHEKSCLSLIHSRFCPLPTLQRHTRRKEKETHFGFPLFECVFSLISQKIIKMNIFWAREHCYLLF